MGCSGSRENQANSMLSAECDHFMKENVELLSTLECLYVEAKKANTALSVMMIKKRMDDFYKIVKTRRHSWLSEAKRTFEETIQKILLEKCEKEQIKEKFQLVECNEFLHKIIEGLKPRWRVSFSSIYDLRMHIEQSPEVAKQLTVLYENFYSSRSTNTAESPEFDEELSKSDKKIIRKLKTFAIHPYKTPERRVFGSRPLNLDDIIRLNSL